VLDVTEAALVWSEKLKPITAGEHGLPRFRVSLLTELEQFIIVLESRLVSELLQKLSKTP
jgi:hypothetical protein